MAAGEAAVSGFVDVTETSEAATVLAGTGGRDYRPTRERGNLQHEYGPSWELLDTADARRR